MAGQPVWLCSMSRRHGERILSTGDWCRRKVTFFQEGLLPEDIMHLALKGLGDPARERCFRMNVTLCIHRAARQDEIDALPQGWKDDGPGMAGGPVEILWERGCKSSLSSQPCEHPKRTYPLEGRADLWVPVDCGKCLPCLARKEIERRK